MISIEELEDASKATGLKVINNSYFKDGCGCPLSVLYCHKVGPSRSGYEVIYWAEMTYGVPFCRGFIGAVDFDPAPRKLAEMDGYNCGLRIREHFEFVDVEK